jgi:hypothetical protein
MVMRDRRADLSRFRYHTGATLRPVEADESCPMLFRDLGPAGMSRFLSGSLSRLAGPMAPIVYLRTCRYIEPYTDYEDIGRLVVLRPNAISPWFSGVPDVYVAAAELAPMMDLMAFVPTAWTTPDGARALDRLPDPQAVREALGGRLHDERLSDLAARLRRLNASLEASERLARPVRRMLQSGTLAERQHVRDGMARHGISEHDLCSAWHHIPRPRREALDDWLHAQAGVGS